MKIEIKTAYNILSNSDIIQYLYTNDKIELSSTCKYIYKKLTRFRLEKFRFNSKDFQNYIENTQKGIYFSDNSYELVLSYYDEIVGIYKNHLLSLTFECVDFLLLNYFSLKFTNLTSLWLHNIILPKTNLINIIENGNYLTHLTLWGIEAGYCKVDKINPCIKFSKYLRGLLWENCKQFEVDSTDLISFKKHGYASRFSNSSILDISLNMVDTLKSLDWYQFDPSGSQLLNETIVNNQRLSHLSISLYTLNLINLNYLSSNSVLTKLTIYDYGKEIEINQSRLINFPNIKVLEIPDFFQVLAPSVNLIIESFPNLEKLKMFYINDCDDYFINYVKKLKNLKTLTLVMVKRFPPFLYNMEFESNLEHIEILTYKPIIIYFSKIINMQKLKLITNSCTKSNREGWNGIPTYKDLKGWRAVKYHRSIKYWKI
jgi:hypothetical protein